MKINILNKKKSYNYILIFIYLLLQIIFIQKIPMIVVDEPWYANTAWNFSVGNGFVDTAVGSGAGEETFLFPFLLGLSFYFFGVSLLTARMVSVIGGIISIIGFINIIKVLNIKHKQIVLLSGFLFIFSNVNYIIYRTARPESWLVAFGVWSLFFLIKGLKTQDSSSYLFSGLFSSASFLCHPHGALYIFLFGVVVLIQSYTNKTITPLIYYVIGLVPILLIFLFHITIIRQETIYELFQRWNHRVAIKQDYFLQAQINNIIAFFHSYSLGIKRVFILIFELGVLLYGLFFYKKDKYVFMVSILGLSNFVVGMIFLSPFATRHFGEILIFSFITFSLLLNYHKGHQKFYKFIIIVGILYLLNNFAGDMFLIWRDHNKTSYSKIEKKIDEIIPDNSNVITLLEFWFPLKNNDTFNSYTRWHKTKYNDLGHFLDSNDLDYVVISDYFLKGVTPTSGRQIKETKYLEDKKKYYNSVHSFALSNGVMIDSLITSGYGTIKIWEIKSE